MSAPVFKGTYTAIVTPFTADGAEVDYASLQKLVDFQISHGVDGIVVCGSTGEAVTLSDAEYKKVITSTIGFVKGRVPVVAGVGSSSTARAVEMASFVNGSGAQAILLVVPPYNKPTQDGIVAHFAEVKRHVSLPIIAYNVPGRTGLNMAPETIAALAKQKLIVALKEANGSIMQVLDTVALVGRNIDILSGEDALIHATMASGGCGVISVISNAWPAETVTITDTALRGDWEASLQAQLRMLPAVRAMFCETNPIPVKAALALRGVIAHPTLRLPLLSAQPSTIARIELLLKDR
ncbi:MAG: 4-hydroxy-tetrahydrodipicolinate synthase [Deltaproteobacteria bacterium]|nr:4-hydroxy-tetrahydrodipicolinate synthase [Deltaproteobacteria bacterium]